MADTEPDTDTAPMRPPRRSRAARALTARALTARSLTARSLTARSLMALCTRTGIRPRHRRWPGMAARDNDRTTHRLVGRRHCDRHRARDDRAATAGVRDRCSWPAVVAHRADAARRRRRHRR